jgi:hypothetical protein
LIINEILSSTLKEVPLLSSIIPGLRRQCTETISTSSELISLATSSLANRHNMLHRILECIQNITSPCREESHVSLSTLSQIAELRGRESPLEPSPELDASLVSCTNGLLKATVKQPIEIEGMVIGTELIHTTPANIPQVSGKLGMQSSD